MILVDTSVWIEHLRQGSERLKNLLLNDQVISHPFIVGELACGNLVNRKQVFALLSTLPSAKVAGHDEVLYFLTSERLYGRGLGWTDVNLLASAVLSRCSLWTLDKRLRDAAVALRVSA